MGDMLLTQETILAAIEHMNRDHQKNLLAYARVLANASWAESATLTDLDASGFDLLVADSRGRQATHRLSFLRPVEDANQLRLAFIQLAEQAALPDGIQHVAIAQVATAKASRYLKALCNHFDRKAAASYDDNVGRVQFPFGNCEFRAEEAALFIRVTAESDAMLHRVKHVVGDHLMRFGANENLQLHWRDTD